jgi:hypothetical protein
MTTTWVKYASEEEFQNKKKNMIKLGWKVDKAVRYPHCIDVKYFNDQEEYTPAPLRKYSGL